MRRGVLALVLTFLPTLVLRADEAATQKYRPLIEAMRTFAEIRRPDRYISYSRECFAYHQDVDRIPLELSEQATYTGVPQFDDFRVSDGDPSDAVVLIDHQFHNQSTLTGRYTFNGENNRVAGSFPLLPTAEQVRAQQAAIGYISSKATSGLVWVDVTSSIQNGRSSIDAISGSAIR